MTNLISALAAYTIEPLMLSAFKPIKQQVPALTQIWKTPNWGYNNLNLYTWDETYDPRYAVFLKNNMERKNGINKGVVITQKVNGLTLLYSFATKGDGQMFLDQIQEQTPEFYKMGDHCFQQIESIITENIVDYNSEKNNKKRTRSNVIQLIKDEYE